MTASSATSPSNRSALADARALFPVTRERAYLFAGAITPAAIPVRRALENWIETWGGDPCSHREDFQRDWRPLRAEFAALIGASAEEIAVTDSTSRGANLALQTLGILAGSNVVVDQTTYPSARFPLLLPAQRGIEMRVVPARGQGPELEDVERCVDGDTAAISVSHVCRTNGYRHDLKALAGLAREAGAYLLVDGAQSVGAVGLDVHECGVDMLYCAASKWLLGPPGVGFLFIRNGLADQLNPPQVGPIGTGLAGADGPLLFAEGAGRHELGVANILGMSGARAGIEILQRFGMAAIEAHVIRLAGIVIEGLERRGFTVMTPADPARHAGVVAFRSPRGVELAAFLRGRKVDIWGYPGEGRVRVDPHLYNDDEDVERMFEAIDEFLRLHPDATTWNA